MISALILDWAGTLADDVELTLQATNSTLTHFGGRPVDLATYRRDFTIPVDAFYKSRLPRVPMDAIDTEFFVHYARMVPDVRLFDGVQALLHMSKFRGLKLFVLSTVPTWILEKAAAAHGLSGVFQKIYGAAFDKRRVLPQLMGEQNLVRDETLYIGDSTHDIEAAKLSGVRSGAALYGYSLPDKLRAANPDYAFESIADVVKVLDREWMIQSQKLVIATVGGIVLDDRDRILLVRTRKWSNTFGIPGGKIDYGETMQAAYEREMKEETGLDVVDTKWLMVQDCIESPEFERKRHFLLINYVSRCVDAGKLTPNYELEEARFVTHDEAMALNLNEPTRIALREAKDRGMLGRTS